MATEKLIWLLVFAVAFESQKCCLSALIRQEDDGFLCRTLDTYVSKSVLKNDAKEIYMYKTNSKTARANFVWSATSKYQLLGLNILINKNASPLNICRNLCLAKEYCMGVDYNKPYTACNINGQTQALDPRKMQKDSNYQYQELVCFEWCKDLCGSNLGFQLRNGSMYTFPCCKIVTNLQDCRKKNA
ncbi:hypothetical protein CAPTEDRAFT_203025 [Capitella teleta]|uniref:Apple domain-containing protein n=1 Tax=Capitella teleta TaxID=283909 RepID=R7TVU9_CAPTE|nr:hypothetical protein CAPTEDRAFT_203025 [Capitella teleta]|eukprot:ELT95135.1 hypothetical protein CAPTEDRAFT_203025 [Capitella teleta]